MTYHPDPHWEEVALDFQKRAPLHLWRAYMQQVYGRLIDLWLGSITTGLRLKTDLFEESISTYAPLSDLGQAIGMDGSFQISRNAYLNLRADKRPTQCVVADLRGIPFRSGSFQGILSGSSLDHFHDPNDIRVSLSELSRLLTPGGVLIITFDNPHNPLVWLRNHLPFEWLNRLGWVPYYVGATYTRSEAQTQLGSLGLRVTHITAVAHVPRALAIWAVDRAEKMNQPRVTVWVATMLNSFEFLEQWPTRYLTGYYLALRAEAPTSA